MADYSEITNSEIEADAPLREGTMTKLRDNPLAIAEGAATVPNANKINPAGFKQPTNASQAVVLAYQGGTMNVANGESFPAFFQAVVCVPGVYTVAGTRAAYLEILVYVNEVLDGTFDGTSPSSFTHEMTLAAGDYVRVEVNHAGPSTTRTTTDFEFRSEYAVPMCQCQFIGVIW